MANLATLAQQLLPPFAYNWLNNIQQARKHPLFPSYEAAMNHCSQKGYENDELIEVMRYKMTRYMESNEKAPDTHLIPTQAFTVLSLSRSIISRNQGQTVSVLDFGGAMGGHYFDVKRILGTSVRLNWAVVETPAMAQAGKAFGNSELAFFDDIEQAYAHLGKVDVLHTSGTLQCVDRPYQFLERLMAVDAPLMLFNRLGLNRKNRDVVTIHVSKLSWNGHYGLPPNIQDRVIKYPFNFMSETDFLQKIQEKYRIVAQFNDDSGIFMIPSENIIGSGLLVEKKK